MVVVKEGTHRSYFERHANLSKEQNNINLRMKQTKQINKFS